VPTDNKAFKALGDPTRRDILSLLRRGEMTAGDLAQRFDMTKPSMSHHFSVLKEADLITSRRDGQQIWYGLNTTVVQDLMAWAMDLIRGGEQKIRGDETTTRGNETTTRGDERQQENTAPEGDAK
jgi:ArsR family transcriptional regulator, arsenate/arsenite/antimonite-responsive transcriptional repressor